LVDIRKGERTRRHNAGQDEIAAQIEALTPARQIVGLSRVGSAQAPRGLLPPPIGRCKRRGGMIDLFTRQIAELERAVARLIDDDRALPSQARLLSAVPGIGPTVLAILCAVSAGAPFTDPPSGSRPAGAPCLRIVHA